MIYGGLPHAPRDGDAVRGVPPAPGPPPRHFASKRFPQPTIIGEIGIGVILGPSVLGFILNGWSPPPADAQGPFDPALIAIFAGLGAVLLLFLLGIEADVRAIYRRQNGS